MLLSHHGLDYEEIMLGEPEFHTMREEGLFEFDQLPVLELDGERYPQSLSILRMLGRMYGYYPMNIKEAFMIDSTMDYNMDIHDKFWPIEMTKVPEEKIKLEDEYYGTHLPKYLNKMENRLNQRSNGSKYLVGDKISIADFLLLGWAHMFVFNESCSASKQHLKVMKNHTIFSDYIHSVSEDVREYLDNRPKGLPW